MTQQEVVIEDFFESVQDSAHDLASAFSQKIHSEMSVNESKDKNGTNYAMSHKKLLTLAVTLETSIRVLQQDLINVLSGIAEEKNPVSKELAIALNGELMNVFEEKSCEFHLKYAPVEE